MARRLMPFISGWSHSEMVWGQTDCAHCIAEWAAICTGQEPELPDYSSPRGALRAIAQAGSLTNLVGAICRPLQLLPADVPVRGDIGVLDLGEETCGIFLGKRWALRAPRGVTLVPMGREKAVWRMRYA